MKHRYILGLDIGIASVGWSCIYTDEQEQPQGILDLGIRRFPLAEDAKTGESFSTAHSLAKLASRCYIRKNNTIFLFPLITMCGSYALLV